MDFKDKEVFFELEEQAIDGDLNYDDFPPAEYKYFSKLSKLGYKNRHDGWNKEKCEEKQKEIKQQYMIEKEHAERFFNMSCRMQENIRKGEEMICQVNKAATQEDKLKYALLAIEFMTSQKGYAKRNEST